jgi:hypothetical protein
MEVPAERKGIEVKAINCLELALAFVPFEVLVEE